MQAVQVREARNKVRICGQVCSAFSSSILLILCHLRCYCQFLLVMGLCAKLESMYHIDQCAVDGSEMLKLPVVQAKTIALEMISVNTALTIIILKDTLPQPEADISSVIPLLSFIFSQLPLFLLGLYNIVKGMRHTSTDATKTKHGSEDTVVDLRDTEQADGEHHEMQNLNQVPT